MRETNVAWQSRKAAAAKHRPPTRIRLLLIDESPPADEAAYFYADGGEPGALLREAGEVLFDGDPPQDRAATLKELRRRGVFVTELKPDAPRKGEKLGPYVTPLMLNLDPLAPEKIVLIGDDVYDAAKAPLAKAGWPVVDVRVPSPEAGGGKAFRQAFRKALVRGDLEALIRPAKKPAATSAPPPPARPRSARSRRGRGTPSP